MNRWKIKLFSLPALTKTILKRFIYLLVSMKTIFTNETFQQFLIEIIS